MAIADKLIALQNDITDARAAVTAKGGTVTSGGGSSQLANDIATIPSGGAKKWGVSTDNFFRLSEKSSPDLEDMVYDESTLPSGLSYALRYAGLKSIFFRGSAIYTNMAYAYAYAFAGNHYLDNVVFDFGNRTTAFNQYHFYQIFDHCGSSTNPAPYSNPQGSFTMRSTYITGANAMTYAFNGAICFKYFAFPATTKIGTTAGSTFLYAFVNCNQCYRQGADINMFRFPILNQIGSGTYGSIFSNCFRSDAASTYHYGHLIFPELTLINCRSSSTSTALFMNCNALQKIYLPKFNSCNYQTTGTTYSKFMFYNSTNITEIHFGVENEATVMAMDGYANKFGATNATLYFDMVNHITVGGLVYDRSGAEYDYDTSHYSWKNGTDVIYTTNAIDPAINDTVYTKSGDTYVSAGTITAVA